MEKDNRINPYIFWERVDNLLGKESLKDFTQRTGLNRNTLYVQRVRHQVPADISQYITMAKGLGVSLDLLVTGHNTTRSIEPKLQEVVDLLEADPSKLSLVRLALGLTP